MTTQAPTTTVYRASQTGADLAPLHFGCTYAREAAATGPPQRYLNTHADMDQRGSPSDEGQMEPTPVQY